MIRRLILVLLADFGDVGDAFVASLPAQFRSRRIGGSYSFAYPAEELTAARSFRSHVREAGFDLVIGGETDWTTADDGQGRLCHLPTPLGPDVNELDIVERLPCPACGATRSRLAASPSVTIRGLPSSPVFHTESGLVTIISAAARSALEAEGLLAGATLVPTEPTADGDHFLLTSDIDLGPLAGPQYTRRCPECAIPLEGGAYFPMFRRPATSGHVFLWHDNAPGGLLVTERFARVVCRLFGAPENMALSYVGWYPDDAELATLPNLDDETGA